MILKHNVKISGDFSNLISVYGYELLFSYFSHHSSPNQKSASSHYSTQQACGNSKKNQSQLTCTTRINFLQETNSSISTSVLKFCNDISPGIIVHLCNTFHKSNLSQFLLTCQN
jgi:hypothetical protein